ncbi:MAG: A/G-specific adenine glycosylase [Gammaproteobacteria bacterium]
MAAAERTPIAPPLLEWARAHGRHGLPWQHPPTPYRVWVSEIMLQQTQVATVIPYFERFMARFPTLAALADAELSDVLALWSGLGYYARARNLHAAARLCCEKHNGELPQTTDELAALPGIGRSTAGAILALAHDRRASILDGNARRVLARYHAVSGRPGESTFIRELWRHAETETPAANARAYTQAIMDLGATLCTRSVPVCPRCPLAEGCAAHATGHETEFPASRATRTRPLRRRRYAWIEKDDGEILFEERPPAGIWGGLLCLPELPDDTDPAEWCRDALGLRMNGYRELAGFRHEFTHFRLAAGVLAITAEGEVVREAARYRWLACESALQMGLPAPIRSFILEQAAISNALPLAADDRKGEPEEDSCQIAKNLSFIPPSRRRQGGKLENRKRPSSNLSTTAVPFTGEL